MSEINNVINAIAPYICMLAIAIVAVYPLFQKHNPDLAAKTQWLYEIAKALVADQATKDTNGAEKKQAAANALLDQAKKSNTKITQASAEGLIQRAYNECKKYGE